MSIRFGHHELDEERFLLQRDDVRLDVRPKVFDLLALLIRARERVVLRDELVMALWGTTAVGAGSLSGLVNELRQVLGEAGKGPSSIRTVHGRGYQFVAALDRDGPDRGAQDEGSGRVGQLGDVSGKPSRATDGSTPMDGTSLARSQVRACAARVPTEGARASLVAGPPGSGRRRVFESASADLATAGFETHELVGRTGSSPHAYSLVDHVVASLVASHDVETIQKAIPAHARELLERVEGKAPALRTRLRDPLASRQYEERAWRSLGELLRRLAALRPLAFVMDDREQALGIAAQTATRLLRLVGRAPIFILITAKEEGPRTRIETSEVSETCIDVVRLESIDRPRLNELLEIQGVKALPAAIAEALAAHVRGDAGSLASVAAWLRAETHRRPATSPNAEWLTPDRRMKRVEPDSKTPRTRTGTR